MYVMYMRYLSQIMNFIYGNIILVHLMFII